MYFAKNSENLNLNLYLILINKYLNEDQQVYRDLFESIVIDAHKLAKKEIDHYQVKSNIYDIVNLFVKRNQDYFANINTANIDRNVFVTIQGFMTSLASNNTLLV